MTCSLSLEKCQFLPELICVTTWNWSTSLLQDSCVSELPIFLLVPNQGQDRDGICRSWGQHHYETFDGIYFFFPGTCSYVLAQDCHSATPQYTVWVRAYRSKLKWNIQSAFNLHVCKSVSLFFFLFTYCHVTKTKWYLSALINQNTYNQEIDNSSLWWWLYNSMLHAN